MQKKKLKKRKKCRFKKIEILILTFILAFICLCFVFCWLNKKVNDKIMLFAEADVNKLSKAIVNKAVDNVVIDQMATNNLFEIEKNSNNDIQIIDFNTQTVNKILSDITNNIMNYFEELEKGNSTVIDIKNNLVTNTSTLSDKEGVIFEIPIGMVTSNAFLSNLGPKIPVRISLNGEVESCVKTKVENYGINNAIITVYVNIRVSEQILLPVASKKITIENDIPIAIKMVQGSIPNYYFNGLNSNSAFLTIPSDS